jgi:hypothetical protein
VKFTLNIYAGVFTLLALAIVAPNMAASTTYFYTGQPFTSSGPNITSDAVDGYFTVATRLADNLTNYQVTPTTYSFTDGMWTITDGVPVPVPNSYAQSPYIENFAISTTANGAIDGWSIWLEVEHTLGGDEIVTINEPLEQFDKGSNILYGSGEVHSNPGVWTVAPEPTTLAIVPLGLLALGLLARSVHKSRFMHRTSDIRGVAGRLSLTTQ